MLLSGLTEQVVTQHVVQAALPGLAGVAPDVYAPDELQLPGLHVLHVDVDVEDEVANLLHGAPGGPVRVDPLREVARAAVAVAELRPGGDVLLHVGRDRDDLEAAGGVQLLPELLFELPNAPLLGRRGRLERRVDQLEAEERNARTAVVVGRRARNAGRPEGETGRQSRGLQQG